MKKLLVGIVSVLSLIALPLMARAASLNYAGMVNGATVRYSTDINAGTNPQTLRERNTANTRNMLLTFDNVSGICRNGLMSFTRSGSGMWIGFGGAALTPTPTMFQGNLQCGGVITVSGNVTYHPAFNTYSGTGQVIEFVGTMPLNGVMRDGWAGGTYGTPGAGPGGGWMPGFGNTSSIMPGWGGSTSNWGMMGGYGSGTVSPNPAGGYMGGGGMMGGGGGPVPGMMGVMAMPGNGTGFGGMNGTGPSGTVGAVAVGGRAGVMRTWINPTAAAIITVNSGIPDRSSPTPVLLKITMPAMQLNKATP